MDSNLPLSNDGAVDRVDFERFLLLLVLAPPLLPLTALLVLLPLLCVPVDVV